MPHELCILDRRGDTRITWDEADPATLKAAEAQFRALVIGGHAMFKLEGEEKTSVQVREFDPTAERIIAVARIAGG